MSLIGLILLRNRLGSQKDFRDEDNIKDEDNFVEGSGSLINFELFLTYDELVVGISIISNGFQLIQLV